MPGNADAIIQFNPKREFGSANRDYRCRGRPVRRGLVGGRIFDEFTLQLSRGPSRHE
jgi:hypothetical protein